MAFLIPCDDIISDLSVKEQAQNLCLNPNRILIGYQEINWTNNTPTKEIPFSDYLSLSQTNDDITCDSIVYILYIDIFLWHKTQRIDLINGSGNTNNLNLELWSAIKSKYAKYLETSNCDETDEKSQQNDQSLNNKQLIHLNIIKTPEANIANFQRNSSHRRHRYYSPWLYRNSQYYLSRVSDIIEKGYYTLDDGKKVNIEKYIKKSKRKTKLYAHHNAFAYMTPVQIDSIYRNYENMKITLINETCLKTIFRLYHSANDEDALKKICVTNVFGDDAHSHFDTASTLRHSFSRSDVSDFNESPFYSNDKECDEALKYLYTNTMVYTPNCVIFDDFDGYVTEQYAKVSVITAYPVNFKQFAATKRKQFFEQKAIAKSQQNNNGKHIKGVNGKQRNKLKEKSVEATEEFMARYEELKEKVNLIMTDRIRRIIEIALYNGCDAIVFDAFGCNEFGNDARFIAKTFADLLRNVYYNCFKSVVFTVIERESEKKKQQKVAKKSGDEMLSDFGWFKNEFEAAFNF